MARRRRRGSRLFGAALAGCMTGAALWAFLQAEELPWLAAIEAYFLDLRFQARGAVEPGGEVVLVLIDERTISHLQDWPLPRGEVAKLLGAIAAQEPRAIAVDLLFAEARPEQDPALAAALRHLGNVILPYVFVFEPGKANSFAAPEAVRRSAYQLVRTAAGAEPRPRLKPVGLLVPPPTLADQAGDLAHATVVLDEGGALRYDDPAIGFGGQYYPSLAVAAARAYLGLDSGSIALTLPEGLELGTRFLPTDRRLRLPVNYYGPSGTIPTHSAIDVLQGRAGGRSLTDKLVFLGASVTGAGDTFVSPFSKNLPGAEHFATAADNILEGRFLRRGDLATAIEGGAILLGGVLAAAIAASAPVVLAAVGVLALLAAWTLGNFLAFAEANLWIGYALPSFAILGNAVALGARRAIREQGLRREAERQRRNLARYFSPRVLDRLLETDDPLALDRTQDAAVMFIDIVGFTAISESLEPSEAIALLREFHGRVERQVFAYAGSLDKYLGDGALACFGVPEPSEVDALNAFRCARALLAEVEQWGEVNIAIGIHYGRVLMGNVGGGRHFEFTVTGDTVNVASRLEALNRKFGSRVAASEAALRAALREAADEETARFLAGFEDQAGQGIRGRKEEVKVWIWRGAEDTGPSDIASK